MTTFISSLLKTLPPTKFIKSMTPSIYIFGFLHPTQMDVNNTNHKFNRVKMLQTMHNYLFVQHHFHRTNPISHMNSRLHIANTKLTSPYYINHSYIIQPNYCEGTLRKFESLKNYFTFSPLLFGAWSWIFSILSRSRLWVRVPDIGHSPTPHIGLTDPPIQDSLFLQNSFKLLILSFLSFIFLPVSVLYNLFLVYIL